MKPARLLRWYPRAWRDRYGEEFLALVQDTAEEGWPAWRLRLGVAWGGLRERGHQAARAGKAAAKPLSVYGRWQILFAGMITTYLPSGLVKPPHPARGWQGSVAFDGVLAAVALAGAVVLAGGVAALPALVRFVRAGGWPKIRRRVGWAAGATVVAGGGLAGLAVVAFSHPNAQVPGLVGVALVVAVIAAGLPVTVVIGLWAVAAVAVARHLTLAPRVRSAQLMLGAVLPSTVTAVFGAYSLWAAETQSAVWLIAAPVQLGMAVVIARQRLQVAARKGRRLRSAARVGR